MHLRASAVPTHVGTELPSFPVTAGNVEIKGNVTIILKSCFNSNSFREAIQITVLYIVFFKFLKHAGSILIKTHNF